MDIDEARVSLFIKKCKRGNKKAFDDIVEMYKDKVFGFAYKLSLKDYDEASDITVEAFTRAYKSLGTFRNEANFYSWICTIVKNVYCDRLKVAKKNQHQSLDQNIETPEGYIQREIKDEQELSPEEELMEKEEQNSILEVINKLPETQSIPIKLYHLEGLGYEEIAKILDVPLGTVKSRINRARKALEKSKFGN